jgi:hypothetical protein
LGWPNNPRLKVTVAQTVFEGIGCQFLRNETDHCAGVAVILDNVVTVDRNRSLRGIYNSTNDADQRGLSRAIRAQQRKNFAAPDLQVDVPKGHKPGSIRLEQVRDRDDRLHGE